MPSPFYVFHSPRTVRLPNCDTQPVVPDIMDIPMEHRKTTKFKVSFKIERKSKKKAFKV